jgi:arsenate reductase-like glutaredoxin family protein
LTKAVDAWYSQGGYEKSDVIKYFKATIEENDLKDWLAKHPEAAAALKRRGITK